MSGFFRQCHHLDAVSLARECSLIIEKFVGTIRAARYGVRESRTAQITRTHASERFAPGAQVAYNPLFATRTAASTRAASCS